MNKVTRSASLLVAALAVFVVSAAAQTLPPTAEVPAKVDEYMKAWQDAKNVGGSVLIVKDGKTLASGGYGLANIEAKTPITPDTKFRIGSVTKQFTAALILLLQEEGKLSVQDPICKYVDPCPESWRPVTLHHLLSMTSGITSVTSLPEWRAELRFKDLRPPDVIAAVSAMPLRAVPGEVYEYSNTNYIVLGSVIEKVSGKTYESFLTERIIGPLKLSNTGLDDGKRKLQNAALGYDQKDGANLPAENASLVTPFAAGSMYSTVGDLFAWQNALLGGRVFREKATLDLMLTPNKNNYAYGLIVVTDRKGRKRVTHGGGIEGFVSDSVYFPDDKTFIAVLSNNGRAGVGEVMAALTAIVYGEPYTLPKKRVAVKVEAGVLDSYVGEYRLAPTMTFKITRDGDNLMLEPTGQPKTKLFAESDTSFFLTVVDASLKFVKDANGKVTGLEFTQAGRTTPATRIESN